MNKIERTQRRLDVAVADLDETNRVLRRLLERVVPAGDTVAAAGAAREVHAAWCKREAARARVSELRQLLESSGARGEGARLRQAAAFAFWHLRGRMDRATG